MDVFFDVDGASLNLKHTLRMRLIGHHCEGIEGQREEGEKGLWRERNKGGGGGRERQVEDDEVASR